MTTSPAGIAAGDDQLDDQVDVEASLPGQRIDVILTGSTTPTRVRTTNVDRVRYDIEAGRRKWPSGADAPFLWFTFLAWSAMKRAGTYAGDFAHFQGEAEHVEAIDADEAVDNDFPTPPGPMPG